MSEQTNVLMRLCIARRSAAVRGVSFGYREAGKIALRPVYWRSPCLPKGGRYAGHASSDQSHGSRRDPFGRHRSNTQRRLY